MRDPRCIRCLLAGACALLAAVPAYAVDGAAGVYALGKRGPLAAFVPKPGSYLTNDLYYYSADADDVLPLGDRLVGRANADAIVNIAQLTWVADARLFGGRVATSLVLPYGNAEVEARGSVTLPNGVPLAGRKHDDVTGFGDPAVGASLGWKRRTGERFRAWSGYGAVTVPVGSYELGRIANLGKNRWALDVGGAYTMANFGTGREVSSVLGVTFNGDNRDTDYSSGTELHLEVAAKQHLPSHWAFGVVGYWYEQLTGDSNNPAVLGDFKGRALAIGPELSYQFTSNPKKPVTLDLRWYHEFETRNRLSGDSVWLTVSVPLSITSTAGQDWTQREAATRSP